jgi:hypothetical protein
MAAPGRTTRILADRLIYQGLPIRNADAPFVIRNMQRTSKIRMKKAHWPRRNSKGRQPGLLESECSRARRGALAGAQQTMATSRKMLPHIDQSEASLRAPVVLDISGP